MNSAVGNNRRLIALAVYFVPPLHPKDIDWLAASLETEQREHVHVIEAEIVRLRNEFRTKTAQIDRLILALTDGTLSSDEFKTAKNKVLLEKRDLEEKIVTLERNRNNWLEPAIRFVKRSKQAAFLPKEGDLTEQRDFFRKFGSNRTVTNKLVTWEPRGAWKHVVNAGLFARHNNAASADAASFAGELVQHMPKLGD